MNTATEKDATVRRRTRMVRPYPVHNLEEALAIATAIQESSAGLPYDRILLAEALGTTPTSSGYTMRLNSSSRYGLTEGGYSDSRIALTSRGEAIVVPKEDGERSDALVDAAIEPDIFRRFYQMLEGKRVPDDPYSQNMIQRELGVHADLAAECLRVVKANGLYVGILKEVAGSTYVGLEAVRQQAGTRDRSRPESVSPTAARIFLGHGGNRAALEFLRRLLDGFGISTGFVESWHGAAGPFSPQASQEMKRCSAAILVFAAPGPDESSELNGGAAAERMAYQLGAASVLYGDRIVILRQRGLDLTGEAAGVRSAEYDPERLEEAGLALLQELHRAGVVRVTS